MMARVVQHIQGQAARVIAVPVVLDMMVRVARHTPVREAHAMGVPVALRMMVLEDRHILDQAVRATRVPAVHAIQAPGGQANDVHRSANNTLLFLDG
jgi:hypothetical protein